MLMPYIFILMNTCTGQCTRLKAPRTNLGGSVSSSKSKDRLHCYIEARNIERLEHDLSGVLPGLRSSEGALGEKKIMIFRVTPEIIEDALLPEPLHSVPILHLHSPFELKSTKLPCKHSSISTHTRRQYTAAAPTWPLRMG
jgi:hypothetical protein